MENDAATWFAVSISASAFGLPVQGNVDVVVEFGDGKRYTATFFTMDNIAQLMARYRSTGENAGGLYFWAAEMIIVNELSRDVITRTVEALLADGDFYRAFVEIGSVQRQPLD
jgi:hypothetical protein